MVECKRALRGRPFVGVVIIVMPPNTTFDEAKNFGMFMIRAVLDGRAGELIDLAKVNLLR